MMSRNKNPNAAEAEYSSNKLIASSSNSLKKCGRQAATLEFTLEQAAAIHKMEEARLRDIKAKELFPDMFEAAKKLPNMKLHLDVAKFNLKEEVKEKKKMRSLFSSTNQALSQMRKEKKELQRTFDELTANLSGKVDAQEDQHTNTALQQELDRMKELLQAKTAENESKDVQILDLKTKVEASRQAESEKAHQLIESQKQFAELKRGVLIYQEDSEKGYAKQLAASNAYAEELEDTIETAVARIEEASLLVLTKLKEAHMGTVENMEKSNAIAIAIETACALAATTKDEAHVVNITNLEESHVLAMKNACALTAANKNEAHVAHIARVEEANAIATKDACALIATKKDEAHAAHIAELAEAHALAVEAACALTAASKDETHAAYITQLQSAQALTVAEIQDSHELATITMEQDHAFGAQQARALIVASLEEWHAAAIADKDQLHARALAKMKDAHILALTNSQEAHALTIGELEEASQAKILETEEALEEMTSYAEHVVGELNRAWYYGARTMESLRDQLKEFGVDSWCEDIEIRSSSEENEE